MNFVTCLVLVMRNVRMFLVMASVVLCLESGLIYCDCNNIFDVPSNQWRFVGVQSVGVYLCWCSINKFLFLIIRTQVTVFVASLLTYIFANKISAGINQKIIFIFRSIHTWLIWCFNIFVDSLLVFYFLDLLERYNTIL
jgi:hypothetical protein